MFANIAETYIRCLLIRKSVHTMFAVMQKHIYVVYIYAQSIYTMFTNTQKHVYVVYIYTKAYMMVVVVVVVW